MAYAENLLYEFIRALESASIPVGTDIVLRIQHLFNLQEIKNWEDLARAKNLIGPLVSRSKEEQDRFQAVMHSLLQEHKIIPASEVSGLNTEIKKVNQRSRIIGWSICGAVFLVFALYFLFHRDPPPVIKLPDHAPAILTDGNDFRTENSILFRAEEDSFTYTRFEWDFGDGTNQTDTNTEQRSAFHSYSDSGTYRVQLTAWIDSLHYSSSQDIHIRKDITCRASPGFVILNNRKPNLDIELIFNNTSSGSCITGYEWNFGDQTGVTVQSFDTSLSLEHRFTETGVFHVVLKALTKDTFYTYEEEVSITDKSDHIALAEFLPVFKKNETFIADQHPLLGFVLAVFILLLLFPLLYRLINHFIRKRQLNRVFSDHYQTTQKPKTPYRFTIAEANSGISADDRVAELAYRMQAREKSDAVQFDVASTLQHTIQQAGFPKIVFDEAAIRPSYLVLVNTGNGNNQQLRLFKKLLETLGMYRVQFTVFYFTGSMQTCFNDAWPDGIPIEKLALQYGSSRLLIYSDGYSLLHEHTEDGFVSWAQKVFAHWKNRALITPVARYSWDENERQLLNLFRLYPAGMYGHLLMAHDFNRGQYHLPPRKNAAPWLHPFSGSIRNYKKYFSGPGNELLYRWLLALSVPEKISWENTLLVGRSVEALYCQGNEQLVKFDHLLRLTSIEWLQDGQLAPRHRAELYAELKKEPGSETLIRDINRELLLQIEKLNPPKDSAAALEQKIQTALLRYQLRDEQDRKNESEELHYLDKQGLLSGFNKKTIYTNEKGYTRFIPGKKFWAWNAGLALILFSIFIFFRDPIASFAEKITGQNTSKEETDSLSWYSNRAAELIAQTPANTDVPEQALSYINLSKKLDTKNDDTLAHNMLLYLYKKVNYQYSKNKLDIAILSFRDSSLERVIDAFVDDSISLQEKMAMNLLHAEGVCRFYLSGEYKEKNRRIPSTPEEEEYARKNDSIDNALHTRAVYINEKLKAADFYKTYPDSTNNLNTLLQFDDIYGTLFELSVSPLDNSSKPLVTILDMSGTKIKSGYDEVTTQLIPATYYIRVEYPGAVRDTEIVLNADMRLRISKNSSQRAVAEICMVNGTYVKHTGDPQYISILVRNMANGAEVGFYNVTSATGKYFMSLPNGGQFSFTVSYKENPKTVYSFSLAVPRQNKPEAVSLQQEIGFNNGKFYANMLTEKPAGSGTIIRSPLAVTEITQQEEKDIVSLSLILETPDGKPAPGVEVRDKATGLVLGKTDAKGQLEFTYDRKFSIDELIIVFVTSGYVQTETMRIGLEWLAMQEEYDLKNTYILRNYKDYILVFAACDTNWVPLAEWKMDKTYNSDMVDVLRVLYPNKKFLAVNETVNPKKINEADSSYARAEGRIYLVFHQYSDDSALEVEVIVDNNDIFRKQGGGIPHAVFRTNDADFKKAVEQNLSPQYRTSWPQQEQQQNWYKGR